MRYIDYLIFYCLVFTVGSSEFSAAAPYTAGIRTEEATVYSGPGYEFYPVLQLQAGDKVEIYYEQGEWCAIRPPIGSFSWVSAKYVLVTTGNIGTVLAEGLASRIGSDYSDDCDTVQVTLKKGESVLILERREMPENHASPVWLKITPPSGEFRWIHKSAFGVYAETGLSPTTDGTRGGGGRLPAYAPVQQVRYDVMVSEIPELPKVTESTQSPALPKVASAHPFPTTRHATPSMSDPFQRAFDELQREAHVVMTRPTDDEVFALLVHRAEELHQIAPTDHDLEKTYHLLESLRRTRFVRRELPQRRPATMNPQTTPLLPKPTATSATRQQQSVVSAYTQTSMQSGSLPLRAGVNVGGHDIVGRLGEFDPLPKGHPPYAVVDERGQIICLISPSAHLDLSSFVGQFVGINGILSYYEKPGSPRSRHLTAQNIRAVR